MTPDDFRRIALGMDGAVEGAGAAIATVEALIAKTTSA